MVLNNDFWEALTINQRRRFAKANCEATYKKAMIQQILAVILGMLVIGLFLPIANKANRYWKGYYSLREEDMPTAAKIMCGINFVLGLVANIVFMLIGKPDDYGMFVNTLSRRKLEDMLNEPEPMPIANNESDDPFRINNFTPTNTPKVVRPIRQGCENISEWIIIAINIAIIVVMILVYSLVFSALNPSDSNEDGGSSTSSNTSSELPASSMLDASEFGDITKVPSDWSKSITMKVNSSTGLRLRKGPSSNQELITTMADKSTVTVLNNTDVADWCFVSYKKGDKTYYGWACAKMGEDVYLVEVNSQQQTSSVDPAKLLTSQELKEMSVGHIQAIIDAENNFIGYVQCDTEDIDGAIFFGSNTGIDTSGEYYYLVTNAETKSDITNYLSKYMIDSLASSANKIPTIEDKDRGVVPEAPVVSYNNSLYVSGMAGVAYTVDQGSFSVLSSSEVSYIVSVSAVDEFENRITYTITMQYTDDELKINSYSSQG